MMSALASRHPKYRTRLCRNLINGACPFGEKCSFLHPAPSILPPSSLTQQIVQWNAFLPQLFALSNRQASLKKMSQISPLRLQGPQLVDEDPSSTTSLLLSASNSNPSKQMPQTRRLRRRKRHPCRHFLRTGGWCPVGAKCKFHHDVAALPSAGAQGAEHSTTSDTDTYAAQGRTISGGVLMGTQVSSPPDVSQEPSEPSQHAEAALAQPYSSLLTPTGMPPFSTTLSDQPIYWPNYNWRACQPYHVPASATTTVPVPVTAAPPPLMQHNAYLSPQSRAQNTPPIESQNGLPLGAYEVNGTTYFPQPVPLVTAGTQVTHPVPVHPTPYSRSMAPSFPYHAPHSLPAYYYSFPNQMTGIRPQISFDPFGSDPMVPRELPVIPQLEDYDVSPIERDILRYPLSLSSASNGYLVSTTVNQPTVTKDHEFPYRPANTKRAGHARRISIDVKKHSRANSG